jgi:hypothetical protein
MANICAKFTDRVVVNQQYTGNVDPIDLNPLFKLKKFQFINQFVNHTDYYLVNHSRKSQPYVLIALTISTMWWQRTKDERPQQLHYFFFQFAGSCDLTLPHLLNEIWRAFAEQFDSGMGEQIHRFLRLQKIDQIGEALARVSFNFYLFFLLTILCCPRHKKNGTNSLSKALNRLHCYSILTMSTTSSL